MAAAISPHQPEVRDRDEPSGQEDQPPNDRGEPWRDNLAKQHGHQANSCDQQAAAQEQGGVEPLNMGDQVPARVQAGGNKNERYR